MKKQTTAIQTVFKNFPQVKLAYAFGSQVSGQAGPTSDYDFAVYLHPKNQTRQFDTKLKLQTALSRLLRTDAVDVVILNTLENPEMKYRIIAEGELLIQQPGYTSLVEPKILNEYFDFQAELRRNGLTID